MSGPPSVAAAYDAIAQDYDVQLSQNPVARYMRECLQRHLARVFRTGDDVLDLTAGTGADALFLARRGVRVVALDISPAMLAQARRAAASVGVPLQTHLLPAESLATLELRDLDGAISTFGGLNTIEALPRLVLDLSRCIRPRGHVIFHALNRFCFWEWARGGQRDRGRLRTAKVGQNVVPHRFYSPRDLEVVFASHFSLCSAYALSVVAAPSLVRRLPSASPLVFALDRLIGRACPGAGDFMVLEFERRDG